MRKIVIGFICLVLVLVLGVWSIAGVIGYKVYQDPAGAASTVGDAIGTGVKSLNDAMDSD